jgi:hypothetical protein
LTIPDGSASAVASIAHTTLPKEDKMDTSLAKVPMPQALVARLRSMAPEDNPADNDPDLLNFAMVESETVYRMSSWL